jgi:hypothetical protein
MHTEGARKPVRRFAGQRVLVLAVVAIVLASAAATAFIYPAQEPFVPTHSNETAGHATWSITNVQDSAGRPLAVSQSTDISIVCAWTSPVSVRPFFVQRVKVLGENADLNWTVGLGSDGQLDANARLVEGQADQSLERVSYGDPIGKVWESRQVTRSPGSVKGSFKDRVDIPADFTAIAELPSDTTISADVALTWDCGSAPEGVQGTLRPDPTGGAYFDAGVTDQDAAATSGGTTISMLATGCGNQLGTPAVGVIGDADCTADEDATPIPIPGYKPVTVLSAGSTIEITVHGNLILRSPAMTFTGSTKTYTVNPESGGYRLVYKLPAPGVYNCSVSVSWMDDLAWTFWSGYVFSVEVQ